MKKPGRNEPCYCGSGEKYKKCHMAEDKAVEKELRQMKNAAKWLRRDLMKYARDDRFSEAFAVGMGIYWNNYYSFDDAELMSMNEAFRFFDWFVFDFQYEDAPRLLESYREDNYEDLSNYQRSMIDAWLSAPPSTAYELLDYDGQELHVAEFTTGEEFQIHEPGGHGLAEPGDLILGRIVKVIDRLEFSTVAAYLPQDEIADLAERIERARTADLLEHPNADYNDFIRRKGFIIIHHALEQAELAGRPPVARNNPDRKDNLARKTTNRLRQMQRI